MSVFCRTWAGRRALTKAAVAVSIILVICVLMLQDAAGSYYRTDTQPIHVVPFETGGASTDASSAVASYIGAIIDPDDKSLDRLECPRLNADRYSELKANATGTSGERGLKFFFGMDLGSAEGVLPRLLGSVVEVANFLGPAESLISIVESGSTDRTAEILDQLTGPLEQAGIQYALTHANVTSRGDGRTRIEGLALLRNMVLVPLAPAAGRRFRRDAEIVFLNDVAVCPDDILELMSQRRRLGATMTCGVDWTYVGENPTFYDVWVARTLQGDSFFDIPPSGSWDSAWNIFWNDEHARARFQAHLPLQVFSCWNGGVVFPASVVTGSNPVRFRTNRKDECFQGEPELFCKDLWLRGEGRIAVVPTVHLEYSNEAGRKIKKEKGHVNDWVRKENADENAIEWTSKPPEKVRCMPGDYSKQSWRPWNEGFDKR